MMFAIVGNYDYDDYDSMLHTFQIYNKFHRKNYNLTLDMIY